MMGVVFADFINLLFLQQPGNNGRQKEKDLSKSGRFISS